MNESNKKIVVRFPPSPTGNLQLGNMRTLLFNYLFAKKHDGRIILRLEDTDKERSKKEFEEGIVEDLAWLGLTYDEMHRQSDRSDFHKEYLKKMVDAGTAYVSKEEATEGKRSEVIRFKNPGEDVSFHDGIRGKITMHTGDLGDFVIAKDFDSPLYHLAVTIDDFSMGVTHVIRGEDHISNTPRQILLLRAMGAPIPEYTHLPLVLAADRSKLSKRNGSVSIKDLRQKGYLPSAVINALAMIGWTPEEGREIFSLAELIERFEISALHHSGAVWNIGKLNWFNREYMKLEMSSDALLSMATLQKFLPERFQKKAEMDSERWKKIAPIFLERINYFAEIEELAGKGELDYFFDQPEYEASALMWKKDPPDPALVERRLHLVRRAVDNFSDHNATRLSIESIILPIAEAEGKGSVLWPLRYALSGRERSPDPFTLMYVLGKDEVLSRIDVALNKLSAVK